MGLAQGGLIPGAKPLNASADFIFSGIVVARAPERIYPVISTGVDALRWQDSPSEIEHNRAVLVRTLFDFTTDKPLASQASLQILLSRLGCVMHLLL